MAKELSIEAAERQARQLLEARMQSVRDLVTGRQALADLREQVEAAEREDVRLYNAALTAGWSPDELRKIGVGEPDKKARVARRARARRAGAGSGAAAKDGASGTDDTTGATAHDTDAG
ncbi:hypothetical protein [Cellulomonas marina]|uniref:Uncharacterized protein n=1 Tax=Cellulomonas marina TaxID=988821 RepID=A0A1I0YWS8_9CELL|nr:hypothetical protein [Cellulomonas marina]GIG28063.1 hypothetical protein Cma02nite_06630 [Cellulomonas marina]SFB17632.1 hypothetical protein SAMN05421867_1096 [Cellulomonas marina]